MASENYAPYLTLTAALGFVTLLLVLFGITVIRNMRFRLKESRLQLRRQVETIDKERNRISLDLHDELGPGLSAVGLLLRDTNEILSDPRLFKALNTLEHQQGLIRNIARDLSPRIIDHHGLDAAINDVLEDIRAVSGMTVKKTGYIQDQHFAVPKSVHLYRLTKEITNNTIKHAEATTLLVKIEQDAKKLKVSIQDNGKGFIPDAVRQSGNGLENIAIRVAALSGTCELNTAPGRGTAYQMQFPVSAFIQENGN